MPVSEISADLNSIASLLNETLRRLKQYGSEGEWASALLDGAAQFASASALFAVQGDQFRLLDARGLNLPERLLFAKGLARAFDAAVEAKDTVVALRTPGEVTHHLSGSDFSERAVLVPIANGMRTVAILFAVSKAGSNAMVELLAGMASVVLERSVNATTNVQIAPAAPKPSEPAPTAAEAAPKTAAARKLPYWATLPDEQRQLHVIAHRFARAKVAEMQLYQPDACRAGREQSNVYLFLKKEIDAARESYRDQFLSRPGMEDYLHLELVNNIADGDENKLGVDYPGHLG